MDWAFGKFSDIMLEDLLSLTSPQGAIIDTNSALKQCS
jgi:hypothetical protein